MKSIIAFLALVIFTVTACSEKPAAPSVSTSNQKEDIILNFDPFYFEIIDDGNALSDGNFYYLIRITDKDGNLIKGGNDILFQLAIGRDDFIKTGSGGSIGVDHQIFIAGFKNKSGEEFTVSAELYDRVENGPDRLAGKLSRTFSYPWKGELNKFIEMDLIPDSGSYKTRLIFRFHEPILA